MANRKRANVTDGTEHAAHVLFTRLVRCELKDGVIHTTGRSNDYERSGVMTIDYARRLWLAMGKCLAESGEETGLICDDVELETDEGKIRFTIKADGEVVARGIVTEDGATKAETELRRMLGRERITRLDLKRR